MLRPRGPLSTLPIELLLLGEQLGSLAQHEGRIDGEDTNSAICATRGQAKAAPLKARAVTGASCIRRVISNPDERSWTAADLSALPVARLAPSSLNARAVTSASCRATVTVFWVTRCVTLTTLSTLADAICAPSALSATAVTGARCWTCAICRRLLSS